MRCHNCHRNAMFLAGPNGAVPLCLDCNLKLEAMEHRKLDAIGRTLNYIDDQMDATAGLPRMGARFQPQPPPIVIAGDHVLNHIRVSDSHIGILNTGTIGSIDNAIGHLATEGHKDVALSLKMLAEGIAASEALSVPQRRQAMELIDALASEAATPPERRRTAVARALIVDLAQVVGGVASASQLWSTYGPAVSVFFGLS